MIQQKRDFIQKYIDTLFDKISSFENNKIDEDELFDIINIILGVFDSDIPGLKKSLVFDNGTALRDAKITLGY